LLPRKVNRYPLELSVIFSWKGPRHDRQVGVGLTRDISPNGTFVVTQSPPPLDADIKLKAFLPPSRDQFRSVMYTHGRVVRVDPSPGGASPGGFAVAGTEFVLRSQKYQ
jgi:hypothetical protein